MPYSIVMLPSMPAVIDYLVSSDVEGGSVFHSNTSNTLQPADFFALKRPLLNFQEMILRLITNPQCDHVCDSRVRVDKEEILVGLAGGENMMLSADHKR